MIKRPSMAFIATILCALALLPSQAAAGWRGIDDVVCDGKALSKIDDVSNMKLCKDYCYTYRGLCGAASFDKDEHVCRIQAACSKKDPDNGKDKGVKSVVLKSEYTKLGKTDCGRAKVLDTVKKAKKIKDCMAACDLRQDCVAVTHNEKKNKCELLNDCTKAEEDIDKKSAIKQAHYTAFPESACEFVFHSERNPGAMAPSAIIHNVTASDCQLYCDADKDCGAVVHNNETDDCYVGESCGYASPDYPAMTSVVKRSPYSISRGFACDAETITAVPTLIKVPRPFVLVQCLAECDKRADCKAAVAYNGYDNEPDYDPDSNCALFSTECAATTPNANTIYSVKA